MNTRRAPLAAFVLAGLAAGGLAGTGCAPGAGSSDQQQPSDPPRNVRVLSVAVGSLEETLEISGPVRAKQGTDIAAEEAGRVVSVPKDKGSVVRKGQTIVMLDRDLLEAEMKAAEADRLLAEYNEKRTRNLFDAQSVSGQEMLQAKTLLDKTSAAAEMARIRYERAAIPAPYDAVVTDRYVEPGGFVQPGMPVARVLDPYTLVLEGSVTESQVVRLREGLEVGVRLDGVAGEVPGRLSWVGFEASPATGKFPIEVHIDNRDLRLRPGVVGRARLPVARHEGVITIPRDAIVPSDRGPTVFVVEDAQAHRRDIDLGPDQGLMVVVEEGLQAGDRLVVRGQRELVEGDPIAVQEEATSADGGLSSDPGVIRQDEVLGGNGFPGSGGNTAAGGR